MAPRLCLIVPMDELGGGPVDPGYSPPWARPPRPPGGGGAPVYPSQPIYWPPYPDQGLPPYPAHPIAPGGPGGGGAPGYPSHPIYWPPYPDAGLPPFPSHPIAPGGPGGGSPPGYWGPNDPRPTHPIYIPPVPGAPDGSPPIAVNLPVFPWTPTHPIELPPEGEGPRPEHPIVLPPTAPDGRPIDWKAAWTPQTGWIVVGIPSEGTEHPTPSAGRRG